MATVDWPGGRLTVLAGIPGSTREVAGGVAPDPGPGEVVLVRGATPRIKEIPIWLPSRYNQNRVGCYRKLSLLRSALATVPSYLIHT
jgi:hypothetical protein